MQERHIVAADDAELQRCAVFLYGNLLSAKGWLTNEHLPDFPVHGLLSSMNQSLDWLGPVSERRDSVASPVIG